MSRKAKTFRPTAFAFPYIAVTMVFVIVPLLLILFYAFRGADGSFTLKNFNDVFTKGYFSKLGDTVGIACLLLRRSIKWR